MSGVQISPPAPMNNENAKKLLFEIQDILERVDVKFSLFHGTALGAWREGNFIKDDKDIDLAIKHEDFVPKISSIIKEFTKNDFKIEEVDYPYKYTRALKVTKYGEKACIIDYKLFNAVRFCAGGAYCRVHNAKILDDLKEIDFLGRKFLIPRDTNRYLELEYGKKWTIPCYNNKKCSAGTLIKNYWNKHKIAIKKTIHTL